MEYGAKSKRLSPIVLLLAAHCPLSSDDSIRPRQHVRRHRQAYLLGGFEIDDELEFRRLLYRQIGWFGAFENFVNHHGDAPVVFGLLRSVRHQAASGYKTSLMVNRRHPILRRQFRDPLSMSIDKRTRCRRERDAPRWAWCFERAV
jgi:hypothetical protein